MKKLVLIPIVIGALTCFVNAQTQKLRAKPFLPNTAFPVLKNIPSDEALFPAPPQPTAKNSKSTKTPSVLGSREIGFTCYELQSNSSTARNIINHGDGSVSFAWTVDDACAVNNVNRGTGYNFWNGTTLVDPGADKRLETIRTGFGQIAVIGTGSTAQEIIFAHKGTPYDFQMSTNGAIGSNTWTGTAAGATLLANSVPGYTTGTGTEQALWGRIATGGSSGNIIHLVSNYFPGETAPYNGPKIKGVMAPAVYSRSTDAGASWSEQSVMLPGYDSTRTLSGSAETYAIDAEASTVAIVYGGLGEDVTLWKSTDDGATFTRTFVDSFKYAPSITTFQPPPTDTVESNDGAVTVVVSPNGTAHVAYSITRVILGSTGGLGFFPAYAGLIYWNDITKQKIDIPIYISDIDSSLNNGDESGFWEVGSKTTAGGLTPPSARYGNRAFLTIPSISVDGNNIFILFSLVADNDSTDDGINSGQSFRDIWVVASKDGGATFGRIQNVTCTLQEEEFFSCLAKRVDGDLHILYGLDSEPGTNIQNGDPIGTTSLRYATIDKAKVLAGTASCSAIGTGVVEHNNSAFNIADNYPNPTSGLTYFDITMKKSADLSIEIFNNIGQQVYLSSEKLSAGKHTLSVDAGTFNSGIYFYTIKSGDAIVRGKMTVVSE